MPGSHHPRGPVEHRPEVVPVPQFGLTGRHPHPHRQLQRALRRDRSVNGGLRRGERGTTPSPVWLNKKPSCASIEERSTSSCATSAARIASASDSHRRVDPSYR